MQTQSKNNTFTGTSKPEGHTTICPNTNRSEHQPSEVPSDIQINEHDNTEQKQAEHPSDYLTELETDKENWDDSQFDDAELLYNHNSTEESDSVTFYSIIMTTAYVYVCEHTYITL